MSAMFNSKVAIVTGSSSGIGECVALKLASLGAKVTLCGRDFERLKTVKQSAITENKGSDSQFILVAGDINSNENRRSIIESTIKAFGKLDFLILNAGVFDPVSEGLQATEEKYDLIMDTNLKSAFFLIQQAVPYLEETKGSIIAISSALSSNFVVRDVFFYPLVKAALDNLVESLAFTLGDKGIRVNTVNPAFIPTRIWRNLGSGSDQTAKEFAEYERSRQPLVTERCLAERDVADAVVFLASDAAAFITGQHIKIDGGITMVGAAPNLGTVLEK